MTYTVSSGTLNSSIQYNNEYCYLPPGRRQLVFKFTHRSKISIFAPQGRLVAPIHVKFGTWVRLAMQNFTPIGAWGWERGLKIAKISTFWQRVTPQGANPFTGFKFQQLLGAFIRPTILH